MTIYRISIGRMSFITARKRSLGQGNVFTPVGDSVHGGGVSAPFHVGIQPLRHTPPGQTHPPGRHSLGRHSWAKNPLGRLAPPVQTPPWACIPPEQRPPPVQTTTPLQSYGIRLTSRRYSSYWNAYLCFHSISALISM